MKKKIKLALAKAFPEHRFIVFKIRHLGFEKDETVLAFSREDAWLEVLKTIHDLGLVFGIILIKHEVTE